MFIYLYSIFFIRGCFFSILAAMLMGSAVYANDKYVVDSGFQNKAVSIDFRTENYSESFSIIDLYDDNPSFVKKGEAIYSQSEFSIEYQLFLDDSYPYSFLIGYFKRLDYQAKHSNGAAKLYYSSHHDPGGESLSLDLELQFEGLLSQGVRLGYQWEFSENSAWQIYFDIGQGEQLMSASVEGELHQEAAEENSLEGSVNLKYYFQNDPIYSRKVTPAKGQIFAISTQFDFNTNISRHRILLKDLYFLARWKNAPYTRNEINSQRVQERDDGSLNIRPLGSGREYFKSLDQTLSMRGYSQHEFNYSWEYDVVLDINKLYLTEQVNLGWQKRISSKQLWQIKYSILDPAIELLWQGNDIGFKLRSDHYDVSSIQQFSFSVGYYF